MEPKQFDLDAGLPNVLLVGNGILCSLAKLNDTENHRWFESVMNLSEEPLTETKKVRLENIPYSVLATIVASTDDKKRNEAYSKEFKTLPITDYTLLKDLVSLGFDSILTTNYTYEIENCFNPSFSSMKNKSPYVGQIARKSAGGKIDSKYLLHTFNQFENSPPIWHIHGEERRKSSIVLTHDEYARLIYKLIEENKMNKNKYVEYKKEVRYKSWLDYFLMSNLYIVGLGMDFSEFDLWWILNRRLRENQQTGKITYFKSIYDNSNISNALSQLGICVEEFGIEAYDRNSYYIEFYREVTNYIKNDMKS